MALPYAVGGQCFACRCVGHRLGAPLAPLFPVRLCPLPGPLYSVLMGYKESPVREARRRFAPMVRALFEDFLASHADCVAEVAGGPLELALPVPSSLRPGSSPLGAVKGLAPAVSARVRGARWSPDLLERATAAVAHMRPDAAAFEVAAERLHEVRGRRVLLIDDVYVSGSRAQSAAAALRRAGAGPIAIVALGRILRPDLHDVFLRANRVDDRTTTPATCRGCVHTTAPNG